ncbi:type IV pilin [Natronorubrum sp. A-ect3]|uniref:type IV pilin n=1 Tax=Natronorubrum sp. A-ect3 TaxID=3242698 RepID=UPI00359CC8E4
MEKSAFLRDDNAVSPVIGVVLLVGISVMTMALVGSLVLTQGGIIQPTPDIDVDYVEQEDDNVSVVVTSLIGTSSVDEDDFEFRVDGQEACGAWDSSNGVGVGDRMNITGYADGGDCADLDDTSSIAVILDEGSQSELLSTYDVRDEGAGEGGEGGESEGESTFTVSVNSYDETVTEGEQVIFDVTIENTGEETDSQNIELEIVNDETGESEVIDQTEVELSSGESTDIELTWETDDGDSGEDDQRSYSATISGEDDHETGLVVQVEDNESTTDEPVSFDVLTVDVSEFDNQDDTVAIDIEYELSGALDDAEVEVAAEVDYHGGKGDDNKESKEIQDTDGTVLFILDVENRQDEIDVDGVIDGEKCSVTGIEGGDSGVDVC